MKVNILSKNISKMAARVVKGRTSEIHCITSSGMWACWERGKNEHCINDHCRAVICSSQ